MTPNEWLDAYRAAWQNADVDAVGELFTEDATYHETPYAPPYVGPEGVREYWSTVTATQSEVDLRYGIPVIDGNRAAVEWWVTMKNGGEPVTLAGEFLLVFDERGRCSQLREYWHFEPGTRQPQPGWGS